MDNPRMTKRITLSDLDQMNEKIEEQVERVERSVDVINEVVAKCVDNNIHFENLVTTLNKVQRELVLINSKISRMEDRLRSNSELERNRNIRSYKLKKEDPIKFIADHTSPL